jgi:hypothetical protein
MRRSNLASAFLALVSCCTAAQTVPVPFINQPLVPETVAPGSAGFTLTVHGAGFAPTAVLNWNGAARRTVVVSNVLLKANILASDVAQTCTAAVTVVNEGSSARTSNVAYFTCRIPVQTVALVPDPNFSAGGYVTVGDFNHDEKLDVAVCNPNPDGAGMVLDVYLGLGKGKFQPPIHMKFAGNQPVKAGPMLAGDFNGDGNLDLAVQSEDNQRKLAILFGDGTGKFTIGTRSLGDVLLVAGDMDGDGNLDLFSLYRSAFSDVLDVCYGGGNGLFSCEFFLRFGTHFETVVIGDFNQDGKLDIAALGGGTIFVAINQGNRTFSTPAKYFVAGASTLATADVNGDGHLDLVTNNGDVFLGRGDGTFKAGKRGQFSEGSGFLITGDFNGDNKLDLILPTVDGSALALIPGNGDGTFQPAITTGYGFATGGLGVTTGNFNQKGYLDLIGPGTLYWQAPVGLSPPSLNFGQQEVGTSSQPQTATVINAGSASISVGIAIVGPNYKQFSQTNNCPSSIPIGATCQIQVTFSPTSEGNKSASLQVTYAGFDSPQSVALSGTGVVTHIPKVSLKPSMLTFPTQLVKTTSAEQTATLTNIGQVAVTITNISVSGSFGQSNNCPSSLPVGQACQIQATFQPTQNGLANGTLSVSDDAPDSPQTVALSGFGTTITFAPIGVYFGSQKVGTSSKPVPINFNNKGTVAINISQVTIGGTNPGDFSQTNNCGSSVPAGGHCTIKVTFTPMQKGTRSAELQVYDDVQPSPQAAALGGTGT